MFKMHNEANDHREINRENCGELIGYNAHDLFELTGAYVYFTANNIDTISENTIYGEYPIVYIEIFSRNISLRRRINIRKRTIENHYFKLSRTRSGLGVNIFCEQIIHCREAGLTEISIEAFGNYKTANTTNGYITWGKLGFTMLESELPGYYRLLERNNIPRMTLEELLLKHGKFWEENGNKWYGKFDLNRRSENRHILQRYLKRKLLEKTGHRKALERENDRYIRLSDKWSSITKALVRKERIVRMYKNQEKLLRGKIQSIL